MDTKDPADLQSQLMEVYKNLTAKRPLEALEQLKLIRSKWPHNKDVEHLSALSHKALGDWEQSKSCFSACLTIDDQQPEVHNNLANLLKSQGQLLEAEEHYLQALYLHPSYLQAHRNLAICYQAQAKYSAALSAFRKALELSPADVSALNGVADCFRLLGDSVSAHQYYHKALQINAKHYKSWHNLGLNFHLQRLTSEAIDCYRKAYELAPNVPEVIESLALVLYETGDVSAAINIFTLALSADPRNTVLHERLNGMLWETEFKNQFGDSYEAAIKVLGNNHEVVLSYASMLYRANQVHQAKSVIENFGLSVSNKTDVLSLNGQIEAELGNYTVAYALLNASLKQRFNKDVARQMVKIDIILTRYSQAQTVLTEMFSKYPNCQLSWALQSLVWRLSEDARYHWLCDYKEFIKTYSLEVPPDYASLDDFLLAVREELTSMHRNEHEPLEQTLRNGTQTAARLLHSPNPVLQALKNALAVIVLRYIKSMPDDVNHPFLSRKKEQFEFSGSWSVRLMPNGYHVNHVHTDGWISSSCYISIPKSMNNSDGLNAEKQGHIKFGESPLQLADRERVELSLEPKPGMVVLFPSYFWHGTYPFEGDESDVRLTAPFDVLPL